MKSLISFILLMFLHSCAGESLLPVKGPEGDPGSELNLAEFEDIPIPLNSKLDKKNLLLFLKIEVGLEDLPSTPHKNK